MRLNFGMAPVGARSNVAGAGSTVNCIREVRGDRTNLYARPGLTEVADIGDGPVRGMICARDTLFIVSGNDFYELDSSYSETDRGDLTTATGRVSMSFDKNNVGMVDGSNFYTWDIDGATFTQQADADIPTATHIVFSDGRFFLNNTATGKKGQVHTHVTAYTPATWDSTDFVTAEYAPDDLVALIADHGQVFYLGTETTELWEYTGNKDFPLEPVRQAFMEYGCAAAHSPAKMDNSVQWLGTNEHGDYIAMRADGYAPRIISDPDMSVEWGSYSSVSDAHSQVWNIEGHSLWILSFPTADKTWVYDASQPEGLRWSEWRRWDIDPTLRGRIRSNVSAFCNGKIVCGDITSGKLYEVSMGVYTDATETIIMSARSAEIHSEGEWLRHGPVEVFHQPGVGLTSTTAQGHDPLMELRYSDDHGKTWISRGTREMGKLGKYDTRCRWRRGGRSKHRIYEVVITDPVERCVSGGVVKILGPAGLEQEMMRNAA